MEEINGLMCTFCPEMNTEEFLSLDDNLQTSNEDTDIHSIICSRMSLTDSRVDSSDEETNVSETQQPLINFDDAFRMLGKLIDFCKISPKICQFYIHCKII